MGDKTDLGIKIDHLQDQIDESQSRGGGPRQGFGEWLSSNIKSILGVGALLLGTNGGQLAAITVPSLNEAKISGAEASALQDTLRMTSSRWMQEIDDARAEVKADCNERMTLINDHWQARMDNHMHGETP